MSKPLKIGVPAPVFDMTTAGGGRVNLSRFKGKQVVLYFYPKDDTKGCTQEAIEFSELADEFAQAGVVVIGVSKDTTASHAKFTAKYGLNVQLASDPDGAVCEAYGVWVEKTLYGRKYMGIQRATFLIGKTGRIERIWPKVKVAGHAAEVLAAVNED